MLASSQGISSWTPLKPQHSNANPNPLANQLWCIDFLTPPTPLIIPHRHPALLESLIPLKNWCPIHARWSKSSLKHFIRFCGIFSEFKTEFYCISFLKVSDCIFEIHQLWQLGFSRVYSNCCCSCSFEPGIIKISQSSHKMYSNKVKLATLVEGNPKAPFSIATTPMCRGGHYSFPGLLYFTLDPYLIMLSAKQGGIKYHFLSLWYDSSLGLNPGLPGHWRTL